MWVYPIEYFVPNEAFEYSSTQMELNFEQGLEMI